MKRFTVGLLTLATVCLSLSIALLVRNRMIFSYRITAIEKITMSKDWDKWYLLERRGYNEMLYLDLSKWKFSDFYPELSK